MTDTKIECIFNPNLITHNMENQTKLEKYNKINIIKSSNPKVMYKNYCKFILNQINNKNFCIGLNSDYVSDSLAVSDALLFVYKNNESGGFATLNFIDSTLKIDVICTNNTMKGMGSFMIKTIKNIAHKLGMTKIALESVSSAVGFYIKQQFDCNPLCSMVFNLDTFQPSSSKTRSKSRSSSKSKSKSKTKRTVSQ
jgi:hypothetical protein